MRGLTMIEFECEVSSQNTINLRKDIDARKFQVGNLFTLYAYGQRNVSRFRVSNF